MSRLFLSSTVFTRDVLKYPQGLDDLPVDGVEMSGGSELEFQEAQQALTRLTESSGLKLLVHNYFPPPPDPFVLNFASADPVVRQRSLDLAKNALDLCATFGVEYYSFHPGYLADAMPMANGHFAFSFNKLSTYAQALKRFLETFEHLHAIAAQRGVRLVLENLFQPPGGIRTSIFVSPEDIAETFEALPKRTGLLLDLGHLHVASTQMGFDRGAALEEIATTFGNRLEEIHLSENLGGEDGHLPLEATSWQLNALGVLSRCDGPTGLGPNVTLEARRLDADTLQHNIALIRNSLAATPKPITETN